MKKHLSICIAILAIGFAKGQTLESYIGEAEANNPEVQAFEIKYNIAKEKVAQLSP